MRRSALATVLGLVLTFAFTTTALAAPSNQTIDVYFSQVSFRNILDGQISGNASV